MALYTVCLSIKTIYYVFEKATGYFMGSGITYFDDDIYGCTEVPNPDFDFFTQNCIWNGTEWTIVPK